MKNKDIKFVLSVLCFVIAAVSRVCAVDPEWTGQGSYRIIVKVEPVELDGSRTSDKLVARYDIDFDAIMAEKGATGVVDLSTIQVHKFIPATGAAGYYPTFDGAVSPHDRPCRFEDGSLSEQYGVRNGNASTYPDGLVPQYMYDGGGRLFNRVMDNHSGSIIWVHNQNDAQPSYYAIYWDTKPTLLETNPSPSPFIGDGDVLRQKDGQDLMPHSHLRHSTGDLNCDGLFDIVVGEQKGNVLFYPNQGTPGNPKFTGCRPITDQYGSIDVGWYASPYLYDWNNDGLLDMLVGTAYNVILWWKNTGSAADYVFEYQGFLQADGGRLETPQTPCEADPGRTIWPNDYFTMPCVCDWNSDGLPDILTGSYLTGQISYYRCTGRTNGIPNLTFEGVIQADGQVLDTVWAAAPLVSDFDNDGKQDLITAGWNYGNYGTNIQALMYYKNTGTAQSPVLQRQEFPSEGVLPAGAIAHPRIVDWNNDGLMDLLVSTSNGSIFSYINIGSASAPKWQITTSGLQTQWGILSSMLNANSIADFDGDGNQELLSGTTVYRLSGSPHSPVRTSLGRPRTPNGAVIIQPGPGYGDHYNWNTFADWDKDGLVDVLCGTHQGNVYFYKNLAAADNLLFDYGVKLKLANGDDVKVGPPVYEDPADVPDFTALQGSRVKQLVDDVDGDNIDDLILTETYGKIWVFLNTVSGAVDKLQPGILVGSGVSRYPVTLFDYNKDGKNDLISGLPTENPGTIYVNSSTIGNPDFNPGIRPIEFPYLFFNTVFHNSDWNKDGDEDFLVEAEYYGFWFEGSFIEHGYIDGQRVLGYDRFCGDPLTTYKPQDINKDCYVNFEDVAAIAAKWLYCYDPRLQLCD